MADREKDVQRRTVEWARRNDWLAWKLSSPMNNGVPDYIFVSPTGIVAFIEFKMPGKRPTPLQERMLGKLEGHGAHAVWADSSEDAISWLKSLD